jgi:hypothetical protein
MNMPITSDGTIKPKVGDVVNTKRGLAKVERLSSCGKFAVVRGAFGLSVERRREMRVEVKR